MPQTRYAWQTSVGSLLARASQDIRASTRGQPVRDVGSVEIVEMLFSVKGATAGAILKEWNVAAASNGAAGMWDSSFRFIFAALGTDIAAKPSMHLIQPPTGLESLGSLLARASQDPRLYKTVA